MKKWIVFLLIVIGLVFTSNYLFQDVYSEENAKKAYRVSVQELKNNWIENKSKIELMFEELESFPFSGQIELQKDELFSIWINIYSNEEYETIELGQFNEGFFTPPDLINLDSLKGNYYFTGTTKESDFEFVLKLLGLTSMEFDKLKNEILEIN